MRVIKFKKTIDEELLYLKTLSTQKHIGNNLNPKSLKNFQEEFAQTEITFLNILSHTHEIAGYIILKKTGAFVQLKRIVIDEKHLGIGAEVMRELEDYVLEHYGLYEIWLDVYTDNTRAIRLYEKLGYARYNVDMENHREVWFYRKDLKELK